MDGQGLEKSGNLKINGYSVQEGKIHCNAVITRVPGAIKSNRVISDLAL